MNRHIDVETQEQRASFYNSKDWKQLRLEVLRDSNYECVECKRLGKVVTDVHTVLEVHHVEYLENHPERALDIDNLIVLCKECHNKVHKRFNYAPYVKSNKWDDEVW